MKITSILILSVSIVILGITLCFKREIKGGQTYYVDSKLGDDKNSGLTDKQPWKTLHHINEHQFAPGDKIFLRCGSVWEGQLKVKGSGTPSNPILLSSYGKGNKPHLNGKGKVDQVILLADVEGWEIENLELSNPSTSVGNRTGILVTSQVDGKLTHFRFRKLYIHDIMGDYSFETKGKNTGGIGIIGGRTTRFDDITIEDCEIGPVNRVGIFTNLTKGDLATKGNRPFTNLVVRNNKIHHCAGDGAIIRYAYRPLIAKNLAYENHNAPEKLVKHGVALWCRSTDEAVFEYNEVHHTRGSMDGQAFDADLDSYRTLVQYNYSHDNEGGFMLVYGSSSEAIVRYNLSINDGEKGKHIFDFPVWAKPRGSGIFHNNTVILPSYSAAVIADEAIETGKFFNNIFYHQGEGKLLIGSEGKSAYFKNNAYYGYADYAKVDSSAILLCEVPNWTVTAPIWPATKIYQHYRTIGGKKNGMDLTYFGNGYWTTGSGLKDFWQNKVSAQPGIGAGRK